jgi:hypothetical protein
VLRSDAGEAIMAIGAISAIGRGTVGVTVCMAIGFVAVTGSTHGCKKV